MSTANSKHSESSSKLVLARRNFLEKVAIASATAAILWPGSAKAVMELWEEGDPLCRVPYDALPKPDGYELDIAYLESFIGVSKSLTGLAELDRHMANQYMERFATHPQLSKNLDLLIRAYRTIPGGNPGENEVKQSIWMSSDAAVRAGAKQLVYLWYISAFYIPLDITPGPKPPLQDDPADTRKKIWVYGTPEQYSRGMIWQVIHAHAPMTPGGPRRYWASKPQFA
jgi:hypothetical protein